MDTRLRYSVLAYIIYMMKINCTEFAYRLNKSCDLNDIPPKNKGRISYIAKLMSVSERSVSGWLESNPDKNYLPAKNKRAILAEKLNVSLEYLEYGIGSIRPDGGNEIVNIKNTLPVFSFDNLSIHNFMNLDVPKKDITKYNLVLTNNAFITHHNDESMTPLFSNGAEVIVDTKNQYKSGSFVIAQNISENEIFIRQYISTDFKSFLSAFNPMYPPMEVNDNIRIIGQIVHSVSTH